MENIGGRRPDGNPENQGEDSPQHRGPDSGNESCTRYPMSSSSASQKPGGQYGVWIGFMEASDEHLIGTLLGVVKPRGVTALPGGQRFEAKAIDEMQGTPWRPSTVHRRTRVRTHIADEEEQGNDEEEESEEIQMGIIQRRSTR